MVSCDHFSNCQSILRNVSDKGKMYAKHFATLPVF